MDNSIASKIAREGKSFLGFCLILCMLPGLFTESCQAADTPSILNMFRKKQLAGDEQSLKLKPEHGPWLILATTVSGPDAEQKAVALANEIRTRMKLPSYVLEKEFDTTGILASTTKMVDELDGSKTQYRAWTQYANGGREQIYAVLVGEFTSTEDPRIQGTLKTIRTAQPVSLESPASNSNPTSSDPAEAESTHELVKAFRSVIWSKSERKSDQANCPMGAAFVTRNPLLPDDFFQAPKIDDFILELNNQVEHSILDCPGRFTVRVASFYGYASTELGNGSKIGGSSGTSDALDKAAEQANRLTLALRKRGQEAYQFHDRVGSYVTIGSFDQLGTEIQGQGFQYNPQMLAIMQEYCGYQIVTAKDPATGAVSQRSSLKSLERVPFDVEGKPMAVPRHKTSRLYSGSLLGG